MSRILIAYASHYGQTERIAAELAEHLRVVGNEVVLVHARTNDVPAPGSYDLVVLGSRVEGGKHAAEIRAYIRKHRDVLQLKQTAFFSVSMAAAQPDPGPDPDGYMQKTFADLGWQPTRSVSFAGGLPYRKYGWVTRQIMKRISRTSGRTTDTSRNHDMTDWNDVREFADDLAHLTTPSRVSRAPEVELGGSAQPHR